MHTHRARKWAIIAAVIAAVLAGTALAGLHVAARMLKSQVQAALGPDSEVGDITLGWSAIVVTDLRIHAPRGWPAGDTLRAARITVEPDLRSLVTDRSTVRVRRIVVDDAYLSIMRTRNGRLRLLPSMLESAGKKPGAGNAGGAMAVAIGAIELHRGAIEFFDASVRQPAHRIRIEQLRATLKDLHLPDLAGKTDIALDGVIKGVKHDGTLSIGGWMELASRESHLTTRLAGVDLIALQPYLIKAAETGVKRGTLDLRLQSTVHHARLHAPGTLTLSHLELSDRGGSFMGLPRQAMVAALKNRDDRITIDFSLDGNLNDPHFSLNDSFAKTVGTAVAGLLGITIEGLAKNLGNAAGGVGSLFGKLLGQ